MKAELALFGGERAVTLQPPVYNPYGEEEVQAASNVIRSGVLSDFVGAWCDEFYGGEQVREFERACEEYFGVRHAIAVNSWTSGLIAAVGALGIEPGDEVIVSPWTMCASATCILVWNAIPVFADIETETFNLDPKSVEEKITERTRAILVPDIFGHAAKLDEIMAIARRYNLKVIEDAAQAPGAMYKGKRVGTIADIGGYSLNYHKHIHTGEGGICVTDDDELAERMRLIRNHAEAVVEGKGVGNLANMVGFNFRLGEIEAAMGIQQLKKLDGLLEARVAQGERLSAGLNKLHGLKVPQAQVDCSHVYYIFGMVLDVDRLGVSRESIAEALKAEGVPAVATQYVNVHRYPMFTQKVAYGTRGYPWANGERVSTVAYGTGTCPVAEDLQDRTYLGLVLCLHQYSDALIDQIIGAFEKVWDNLDRLR